MPYKETKYTIGNQRAEKKRILAAKRSKTMTINNHPSNLIRCLKVEAPLRIHIYRHH